jgi:hypothetical protein
MSEHFRSLGIRLARFGFPSRAAFLEFLVRRLQLLLGLRRCFIGGKRTLALQCGHERKSQKVAPFLSARLFVGELQELPRNQHPLWPSQP